MRLRREFQRVDLLVFAQRLNESVFPSNTVTSAIIVIA
jgi:hypothetical protein